jgi:predicted unusual protein kinase regulating ubiquinone biosynthesis (AarF/ABC1/UbiB family)
LESLQVGSILASVLEIGRKYQVVIETNFTTLVIGTIVVEGLAKTLNPNFEFIKTARPFLQQDKTLRDAFITSQLTQVLKKKDWRQRIQDWIDLF